MISFLVLFLINILILPNSSGHFFQTQGTPRGQGAIPYSQGTFEKNKQQKVCRISNSYSHHWFEKNDRNCWVQR